MSASDRISPKKRRAVRALLASKSTAEAARACGLSERTLARYLDQEDFQAALVQAEEEQLDLTCRRLLSGQVKALNKLEDVLDNTEKDSSLLRAIGLWMDYSLKVRELRELGALEERLAKLEEVIGNAYKKQF